MKTRKNTAIILSAMLVCGALTACGGSESEPFVNPKDAIVTTIGTTPSLTEAEAPAEQVESLTAADADAEPKEDQLSDGAAFAPATGILTLSGKVTREDLEPYADNEAVEAIYAAEGTVFPEDCTNLFLDLEAYYTVTFLNTHEVYTLVQFSPYIFQKVCFKAHNKYLQLN